MKHKARSSMLLFTLIGLGSIVGSTQQTASLRPRLPKMSESSFLSLPHYGVFDLLTFNVDANDVVTLAGYVVTETLKKDAEREAREVKGVKEIQHKIVIAPLFPLDDEIRHGVYHAIYWDSALSRYGTSDNELRSIRPGFRRWGSGFGGWGRRFNGPGARVDSRRFGGLHLAHANTAPLLGTFGNGANADHFPGLVVLMSSNRSGAGSGQNVANLFHITTITDQRSDRTEVWSTWSCCVHTARRRPTFVPIGWAWSI